MDPTSRLLMMAQYAVPSGPLSEPLLFPMSRNSAGQEFVHAVKTNGTVVGSWPRPALSGGGVCHAFFYNPYLVVWGYSGNITYIVDCNTMSTVATINGGSPTGWFPWQDGQYASVNALTNQLKIMDIPSATITDYSYSTDAGYGNMAQNHMTVGFANNGSTLFSSLQNRYWWSIGITINNPAPIMYYYADKISSTSLGTRSGGYQENSNYSRAYGISMSSNEAIFGNFGGYLFKVNSTSTTPIRYQPQGIYFGGQTYYQSTDSINVLPRCGAPSRIYACYYGVGVRRVGVYQPFSSSTPSSTDLGVQLIVKPDYTYESQSGSFMSQINANGYVALAYWDASANGIATNVLRIRIYNGTSLVSNLTTTVPSSLTAGNGLQSDTGINGCNWTTNLLYAGSAYS